MQLSIRSNFKEVILTDEQAKNLFRNGTNSFHEALDMMHPPLEEGFIYLPILGDTTIFDKPRVGNNYQVAGVAYVISLEEYAQLDFELFDFEEFKAQLWNYPSVTFFLVGRDK